MCLLNTSTYTLEEFPRAAPPYAIISHTWDVEEVSFHDIQDVPSDSQCKGFTKVSGCCHQARLAGYDWVWIDTCCIDKSSTAEVSEVINSMYGWYQRSAVCFVYLSDIPRFRLTDSRWFERGWTLQELIAPRHVEFYTADWLEIGTKSSLETIISSTTGSSVEVLRGASPRNYTTAERMSWASGRRTTRPEDEAYCLMGLFDVNIPILYGEARPFERLQQEIMRQSEDFSLLAWSPTANQRVHSPGTGVLAPNPTVFKRPDLTTHLPSTVFGFDDAESVIFADVGTLGWKNIQPHRWGSASSFPVHQFMFDPPLVTGRGISVTLPIDMDEVDECEDPGYPRGGECEVLAWIYTNVAADRLSSSRCSSRSSRGRRRSTVDGGVMVCIRLTVTFTEDHYMPLRAVRTPGRGPVCVPNMFMGRFRPRHVYLQLGQGPEALVPEVRSMEPGWEETLGIEFDACEDARELHIVSHFPPTAVMQHPMPGKHEPTMGAPSPRKYGSLWGFDAHQFEVALSDGTTMSASAALLLCLPSADTETEKHFVALFGYSPSAHPHCHLKSLNEIDLAGREFWPHFLRRRTPREAGGNASDRSTLVLPCGVGVAAAAKQRPGGVPTLTLRTFRDGAGALEMMGRTLSTS